MKPWKVKLSTSARREYRSLPPQIRAEVRALLDELRESGPELPGATPLDRVRSTFRLAVHPFRIVYQVGPARRIIFVTRIRHRSNVYEGYFRNPLWIPNPTVRAGRRPVELLTDRAKRYRANAAITQRERRCIYCGAPPGPGRRLEVEHIDGNEANNGAANLAYVCRSCNTRKGAYFARRRTGRRTRQFNPRKKKSITGARTLAEYMETLNALHGYQSRFTLSEAIEKMHRTPPEDRSQFAREIWERRREHGTDRRVPF